MYERPETKYFRYSIVTDDYYLGLMPQPFLAALGIHYRTDYYVVPGYDCSSLVLKRRKKPRSLPGLSLSGLQDVYIPREALKGLDVAPGDWVALTLDLEDKQITIRKKLLPDHYYHDWEQLAIFDQELMDNLTALVPEQQSPHRSAAALSYYREETL